MDQDAFENLKYEIATGNFTSRPVCVPPSMWALAVKAVREEKKRARLVEKR